MRIADYEIICVNDGSKDDTLLQLSLIKNINTIKIVYSKTFSVQLLSLIKNQFSDSIF